MHMDEMYIFVSIFIFQMNVRCIMHRTLNLPIYTNKQKNDLHFTLQNHEKKSEINFQPIALGPKYFAACIECFL